MDDKYQLGAKRVKRNVLEAELDEEELWVCDEYHRLERQIAELQGQVGMNSEATSDSHSE
jgi:hypothetical protein